LAIALGNVGWSLQGTRREFSSHSIIWSDLYFCSSVNQGFEKEKLIFWQSNLAYAKKQVGDYEDAETASHRKPLQIAEREFRSRHTSRWQ
jgi:hypothetical protein